MSAAVTLSRLTSRASRALSWVAGARSSKAAFAHTLLARLLLVGINFCTGILVARSLEARGRGEQASISIWPVILSGVFAFGVPIALRYRIARDPARATQFFSAAVVFAVAFGFVAVAIGWVFVPHWLANYDARTIHYAQLMLLFTPGSLGLYMVQAFLEATGRFRQSNAVVYGPPASTLLALVVLELTHHLTPLTSALAYFIPTNVLFLVRIWSLRDNLRFPVLNLRETATSLFSYGSKAYGIDVLVTLSTQIDQALVIRFLSASQLGVYTVSLAVSRLLNHLSTSLTTVLLPKASALPRLEAIGLVGRAARMTLAATAIGALFLAIATPVLVPFFYGHEFDAAVRLSQILFVEVTLGATINVLGQAFLSTGRPAVVTALQGVGLAATIPLMLVMIPRFGLIGAAVSLLLSTALRLAFVMACFPTLLHTAPPNLVPTAEDVRQIVSRLRKRLATAD